MKRLREFFEKIAFAGLKPGGQKAQGPEFKWLGRLSGPVERFLSGSAQSDPLYLTNRTANQKLLTWALIGIPCLLLLGAIGVVTSNLLDPPEVKPAKELTAQEVAAKLLPNMQQDFKVASNRDVQVAEVAVQHTGSTRLVGLLHNSTNHEIAAVDLVFDLTDGTGSQVGGVSGTVERLPANASKQFQIPIKQKNASFALVRDIISR